MPKKPQVPLKLPIQPHLQSSVVLAKDLEHQPNSTMILIVGAGPERKPNYYAVDDFAVDSDVITFHCGSRFVYACRVREGSWALVSREASQVENEQSMLEFAKTDAAVRKTFYQALDPEAYAQAEEEAKRPQSPFAFMMPSGPPPQGHPPGPGTADDKPTPGQYL